MVRIAETDDIVQKRVSGDDIHLPSPSYWPIVLSAGLPFIAYGLIFSYWWLILGAGLTVAGIAGWIVEPSTDPDAGHDHHDAHDDGDDDHGEAITATDVAGELETVGAGVAGGAAASEENAGE